MKPVNLLQRETECCNVQPSSSGKPSLWFSQFILCTLMILIFQGAFVLSSSAQSTGGASIQANFGVDADLYANMFQFPDSPCVFPSAAAIAASDDWFPKSGGTGRGII